MLTEDQRMQMMSTGLCNCFCTERTLAWSRSQLLTIVSVAGLSPLLVPVPIELRFVIIVFGFALSAFWYRLNQRSRERINYWRDCLARMEPAETFLTAFRVFTGSESGAISERPLIYAENLLPSMFILVWIVALFTNFLF